jgi:hypothetical protein
MYTLMQAFTKLVMCLLCAQYLCATESAKRSDVNKRNTWFYSFASNVSIKCFYKVFNNMASSFNNQEAIISLEAISLEAIPQKLLPGIPNLIIIPLLGL